MIPGARQRANLCTAQVWRVFFACACLLLCARTQAADSASGSTNSVPQPDSVALNAGPFFEVHDYEVRYSAKIFSNAPPLILTNYMGTNVSLGQIVQAASEVLTRFQQHGYPDVNVSLARERITNGVVTMNVYEGVFPQVLISGKSLAVVTNVEMAETGAGGTNNAPAKTNDVPRFNVHTYEVRGDTLLSTNTLLNILAKGTGTNVSLNDIIAAASDLQKEYRDRGYPTVNVTLPPQQITNGTVKIRVFEGRLSEIRVTQNRYFSSNNVMRALPSLHTNIILLRPVFQAELDRANANQDRQIYPQLAPGAEPGTSLLRLVVKDRLPLHAKTELNNESSPGTPDLRVNSSAVFNNLWQLDESLGLQYSFSPEDYKRSDQWSFYDKPLVANFSGFYRLPLGYPDSISEQIASEPGSFGYNEGTRKFVLPPASGVPELNIFASRSTIDTGIQNLGTHNLTSIPGVISIDENDVQQDVTVNNGVGFRLNMPLPEFHEISSVLAAGFDYKDYNLTSNKTNNFETSLTTIQPNGAPNPPIVSVIASPVPKTYRPVDYLPFTIRWDANRRDDHGVTAFGIGYSVNFLTSGFSDSKTKFQNAAGSTEADGSYHIVTASFSREQEIFKQWKLGFRADGQWANEPLLSNEQFGAGGVGSVRGYHEGEIFGDTGWHLTLEQKTPPHVVGTINGKYPLVVRGSVYVDYADTYLLDPQGRNESTPLWGTGFGAAAALGSAWEARFLFSLPLLRAGTISPYQPFFNFALTAQF